MKTKHHGKQHNENKYRVVSMEQLIEKLQSVATDVDTYYKHVKKGTLEQYYNSIITEVVIDIVSFPLYLAKEHIDIDREDAEEMLEQDFPRIATTIAKIFAKDEQKVASDIIHALQTCPVQDVRTALKLRMEGKLH